LHIFSIKTAFTVILYKRTTSAKKSEITLFGPQIAKRR